MEVFATQTFLFFKLQPRLTCVSLSLSSTVFKTNRTVKKQTVVGTETITQA